MIWTIRDRRAFQQLARSGRRIRTRTLWCTYLSDPAAEPLRVAFAIGRAVGSATERNRIRRRLRAIVATAAPTYGLSHGWLLIGVPPSTPEHTFASLSGAVQSLFEQLTATTAANSTTTMPTAEPAT